MKMDEQTSDIIFRELCKRVGLPYPPPPGEPYKVDAATWTQEQEDDFKGWLRTFLGRRSPWRLSKRLRDRAVDGIIFQFGWVTRRDDAKE